MQRSNHGLDRPVVREGRSGKDQREFEKEELAIGCLDSVCKAKFSAPKSIPLNVTCNQIKLKNSYKKKDSYTCVCLKFSVASFLLCKAETMAGTWSVKTCDRRIFTLQQNNVSRIRLGEI